MLFKFTMLFQHTTATTLTNAVPNRLGGFSESWYFQGNSAQDLYAAAGLTAPAPGATLPDLMSARAGFLPNSSFIVGARVQQLDPLGPSQPFAKQFPGQFALDQDIPQMALLCTVPGLNVKNIRRTILRALPDGDVLQGEWVPRSVTRQAVLRFFSALGAWRFRGLDLAAVNVPIITILTDGTVTLGGASAGFAINDKVKVLRTRDATDDVIGGIFTVTAIPGATSLKIANWTAGACTGGSIRKHAFVYPLVDVANSSIGRVVTKRVGRPFTAYRGRRSRRS